MPFIATSMRVKKAMPSESCIPRTSPFKLLAADDDPMTRLLVQPAFTRAGIGVEAFASAAELIEEGNLRSAAVLLLAVRMPDVSGLEFQDLLKERGRACRSCSERKFRHRCRGDGHASLGG
jgi:CheY-like chemotaxis protein